MRYCPFCGEKVELDAFYCLACGKKLPDRPKGVTPSAERTPTYYAPQYPIYQPRPYHPSMKAPLGERCVALIVDDVINTFCCFYIIIKDGIREGQSIGKGLFQLRVVDYSTGLPGTIGQSFIRNCLCGWLDICCCYLSALMDEDGRRIGDHIAGTVVIIDR